MTDPASIATKLANALQNPNRPSRPPPFTLEESQVHKLALYLLSDQTHAQTNIQPATALDILSIAIVPSAWPEPGLPALRDAAGEAAKSGVCGKVWKEDRLAYKCKTCERDPTCIVCLQCFNLGDHTGHDYAMVRTSGGCCDCGDAQAWHPDGFCSQHSGACAEDEDPSSCLHPVLRRNLIEAVSAVSSIVLMRCAKMYSLLSENSQPVPCERNDRILDWLAELVQCGDGIRRVVGQQLISTSLSPLHHFSNTESTRQLFKSLNMDFRSGKPVSWLSLMLCIDGSDRLPEDVQTRIHAVYFQLITDLIFKRAFLEQLVSNYGAYVYAQIPRSENPRRNSHRDDFQYPSDILANFSVQLFTVPALVPVMIRKGGLLDVLVKLLLNLFESSAAPIQPYTSNVPYAESAFANEFQSPTNSSPTNYYQHVPEATAASSSTPQSSFRRKYSVPLPFPTKRATRKKATMDSLAAQNSSVQNSSCPAACESLMNHRERTMDALQSTHSAPHQSQMEVETTENDPPNFLQPQEVQPAPNIENRSSPSQLISNTDSSHEHISNEGNDSDGGVSWYITALPNTNPGMQGSSEVDPSEDSSGSERIDHTNSETFDGDEQSRESFGEDAEMPEMNEFVEMIAVEYGATLDELTPTHVDEHVEDDVEYMDEQVVVNALQAENGLIPIERLFRHAEDGQISIEEDFGQNSDRHASAAIWQPFLAFEEGLRPMTRSDLPKQPHRAYANSRFMAAVREARVMEKAAADGSGPIVHTMRIDWTHHERVTLDMMCSRVVNDLKFVLTHRAVAYHLVHERPDLFRLFVRIISIAQGMNPNSRRFGDHMHQELDVSKPFLLEIEIYFLVELISAAFCSDKPPKSSSENEKSRSEINLPASRLRAVGIIRSCLDEWLEREAALEARSTFSEERFSVSHSVSVHLPLHRFFSLFVYHVLRLDNADLHLALSGGRQYATAADAQRLLIHPLRLQSFLSQVRADMWRRNGRNVAGQTLFYRNVSCSEWFVDLDIFLQQCCAVILGPDAFVRQVQETFGIRNIQNAIQLPMTVANLSKAQEQTRSTREPGDQSQTGNDRTGRTGQDFTVEIDEKASGLPDHGLFPLAPKTLLLKGMLGASSLPDMGNTLSELAEFVPTIIEDMLVYFVRISSERSRCGYSEADFLRRKLIHLLCSRDRTHSSLYKSCSFRVCYDLKFGDQVDGEYGDSTRMNSLIETILDDIAEYIAPKGMEQGKYKLKDSVWKEFDPFVPHLSPKEKCDSEVRYESACKRSSTKFQAIPAQRICDRDTYPQLAGLSNIASFLCQLNNGSIIKEVIVCILEHARDPQIGQGAVAASLHLICEAAEVKESELESGRSRYWASQCVSSLEFPKTVLGMIIALFGKYTDPTFNTVCEFEFVVGRILRAVYSCGNVAVRAILTERVPKALSAPSKPDVSAISGVQSHGDDSRRKMLLERKKKQQAAALEEMRLAQAQFSEHIASTGDDDKSSSQQRPAHVKLPPRPERRGRNAAKNADGVKEPNVRATDGKKPIYETAECDSVRVECALCHDSSASADKTKLIGLIGFHQKTRLPLIAEDICSAPLPSGTRTKKKSRKKDGADQEPRLRGSPKESPYTANGDTDSSSSVAMQIEEEWEGTGPSESSKRETHSEDGESTCSEFEEANLRKSFILNARMLRDSVESSHNLHMSFCGHAMHLQCFERYFSSLLHSRARQMVYEGYSFINLEQMEFLCPVCRRIANIVLPLMKGIEKTSGTSHVGQIKATDMQPLSYDQWIDRCNFEVANNWSREYSDQYVRWCAMGQSEASSSGPERGAKGEIANTVNSLRTSIINRCKVVLQRFGLQGFQQGQASDGARGMRGHDNGEIFDSYSNIPSAAISTVTCVEIASRSGAWEGNSLEQTRKKLRIALREARSEIMVEPGARTQGLEILWTEALTSVHGNRRLDPFATFAFMFLLWSEPLNMDEVRNIVQFGFNLMQTQPELRVGQRPYCEEEITLQSLLFLRRASIMVASYFEQMAVPPLRVYSDDGRDASWDDTQMEVSDLASYLGIRFELGQKLTTWGEMSAEERRKSPPRDVFHPRRVGLFPLPELFQVLLEEMDQRVCYSCKKIPKQAALCLVCGRLMCSDCEHSRNGKMSSHAELCGSGIGIFLILKKTTVEVLRNDRSSSWGSPYLDAHGEEDRDLNRGKPLFLNKERFRSLEHLWLTHGFDQDSRMMIGVWNTETN